MMILAKAKIERSTSAAIAEEIWLLCVESKVWVLDRIVPQR